MLKRRNIGADGLKTGHTVKKQGYGLDGSRRNRATAVIDLCGFRPELPSIKVRAEEAERLVNWAFRQFIQRTVLKADARLTDTQVWLGDAHRVGLVAGEDVNLLVPAVLQGEISATVEYETPVTAPVTKGQPLGELVINMPDMEQVRVPLLAENDVAKGGFLPRLRTAATVLFEKINSEAQACEQGSLDMGAGLFITFEGIDGSGQIDPGPSVGRASARHGPCRASDP